MFVARKALRVDPVLLVLSGESDLLAPPDPSDPSVLQGPKELQEGPEKWARRVHGGSPARVVSTGLSALQGKGESPACLATVGCCIVES